MFKCFIFALCATHCGASKESVCWKIALSTPASRPVQIKLKVLEQGFLTGGPQRVIIFSSSLIIWNDFVKLCVEWKWRPPTLGHCVKKVENPCFRTSCWLLRHQLIVYVIETRVASASAIFEMCRWQVFSFERFYCYHALQWHDTDTAWKGARPPQIPRNKRGSSAEAIVNYQWHRWRLHADDKLRSVLCG